MNTQGVVWINCAAPKATIEAWIISPEHNPSAMVKAVLNPRAELLVMTYKISGPGDMVRTTDAKRNDTINSTDTRLRI